MGHHIDIAWALKIDHAQLGARLEAYVESKSAITILRACLLRLNLPSNSSIPPEISQMIVDELRIASYKPKIYKWHQGRRCVQDECNLLGHFTRKELADLDYDCSNPAQEYLWEERREIHDSRVKKYLQRFKPSKSQTLMERFAICKAIFAKDFGITPYFEVLESYEDYNYDAEFKSAEISGYLTESIVKHPVRSEPGPNFVCYSFQHSLDQRLLSQPLSTKTKQNFKAAVKALTLEANHTHTHVKVESDHEQDFQEWLPEGTEAIENEECFPLLDSSFKEKKHNDEGKSQVETMSCGCTHATTNRWGQRIKYKAHCIDCDTDTCKSRFKASEPVLMLLGSGELDSYSIE